MYDMLLEFVTEFWAVLAEMSPYLLFGFLAAGVLSVLVSAEFVERHLGGRGIWPVVKAAIFGIPLPLCSCGVIPVTASLRKHGATRGAATAFLISTPQTGVDSILVTFSLLGPVFAIYRPVAALLNGILGGAIVSATDSDSSAEPGQTDAPACQDHCCSAPAGSSKFLRAVHYGFVTLAAEIARPLLIGLLVAAAISASLPSDFFAHYLGSGIGAMLVMMLVGIPIYVCATASVPVAVALIAAGISPGAALVFLLTGPATNAAAITTIWQIMGKRTAIIYLSTVAITALACGLLLDYIFSELAVTAPGTASAMMLMLPDWVKLLSALVLLGLLAPAMLPRRKTHTH